MVSPLGLFRLADDVLRGERDVAAAGRDAGCRRRPRSR